MKNTLKSLALLLFSAWMATFYGCKKDTEIQSDSDTEIQSDSIITPINRAPILTTSDISMITLNSVVAGGNIIWDGRSEVIARGICWSRSEFPTTGGEETLNGTGTGHFSSNLTNLIPGTTYFLRAYATNSAGTSYGNQVIFTTQLTYYPQAASFEEVCFSIGTKVYIRLDVKYDNDSGGVESYYKDFWEWDKTTNVWTKKADYPGGSGGVAVSFSIGTKGYLGFGQDLIDGATNEFWEYDPSSNSWTKKASLPPSRTGTVGFSIGTKGYIGTGHKDPYSAGSYPDRNFQDFWEWDQATNIWSQKANFGGIARAEAVGFSIGNKGYIGTGTVDGKTLLNDFWEWDQATNVWTQRSDFGGITRFGAVAFSIGNKGYIGTGYGDGNTLLNDFWEWDQTTNVWTKKADFGGSSRFGAVGFSIGNNGYIGTGYLTGDNDIGSFFQDFWEWDQANNTWTKKADFPGNAL